MCVAELSLAELWSSIQTPLIVIGILLVTIPIVGAILAHRAKKKIERA